MTVPPPRGFTFIELIVAMLLLALLTAALTLSFAAPLKQQRLDDSIAAVQQFDADARSAALARGQSIRVVFDPFENTMSRYDDPAKAHLRARVQLPLAAKLNQIKIANQSADTSQTTLDISANGWSRSYAVNIADRWVVFSGLSGQTTLEGHEPDLH